MWYLMHMQSLILQANKALPMLFSILGGGHTGIFTTPHFHWAEVTDLLPGTSFPFVSASALLWVRKTLCLKGNGHFT